MGKLLANLHWLIIFYALYSYYDDFTLFEQKKVETLDQKSAVESQLNINKSKLKKIEKYRKDLDQYKQWVVEVTEQIEKLRKRLPSEINDGFMMQSIREKASEMNIINPLVKSGQDVLNGFYIKKNYTLNGRGTFLQFLIFLENIDKFEQILNVSSLELSSSDRKNQKGRFFMIDSIIELEAFRYNAAYVDTSINKEPAEEGVVE